MKQRVNKAALCLLSLSLAATLLAGCWDRQEIEDRALILGMAIDEVSPTPEDKPENQVTHLAVPSSLRSKMIRLTAQIAVPGRVPLGPGTGGTEGSGDGGTSAPVWVVQVIGRTLDDALNNLQQEIADRRTLIHLRVIVISEAIAKRGLQEIDDYLKREPEVRRTTWLLVSDGEAADFMKMTPPLERVPTLYLQAMIEKAAEMGKFPQDDIGQFWSSESKWGKEAFLPYISIRNKDNILIKGLVYFRGNQMVGTTKPIEIGIYMALKGLDPAGYTALLSDPSLGTVMVSIIARETKIRTKIINGKPAGTVKVHLEAKLVEKDVQSVQINTSGKLKLIEKTLNTFGKQAMDDLLAQLQQDKSDIIGFGESIRAHNPSYWRANIHSKTDWEEVFSAMPVEVSVNSAVRRIGLKNE